MDHSNLGQHIFHRFDKELESVRSRVVSMGGMVERQISDALTALQERNSPGWAARDHIDIVGSSTVYPLATVVAEHFGKGTHYKTPKVESTGSGGGLKLFCTGIGVEHPDITNSSRTIKDSELELCRRNGVTEITEVKIGYDGIAVANSRQYGRGQASLHLPPVR